MPDITPSPIPEGTVCTASKGLDPIEVEEVLSEFRHWLQESAALDGDHAPVVGDAAAQKPIDLHSLLGQFTAVRHEINLQTKASRKLMDTNDQAVEQLAQALDRLQKQQQTQLENARSAGEEQARPFLKTFVDLYDVLSLADKEVRRMDEYLIPALAELQALPRQWPAAPRQQSSPSLWSRLFSAEKLSQDQEHDSFDNLSRRISQLTERVEKLATSIITGYAMSVQRLEKALQEHNLNAIATVAEPFDPERMEAVEVVVEPGRTDTEVIEEVRRGYEWNGRVFRYAQVKVAKPDPREVDRE